MSAVLKYDHEVAQARGYAQLLANCLALFLGIPVLVGVPTRAAASDARLRFAALRAVEVGLDVYDCSIRTRPAKPSETCKIGTPEVAIAAIK